MAELAGKKVWFNGCLSEADTILARVFLEVGRVSAMTQVWGERAKVEQRCFNCQKYGHLACACKDITVCGNCAQTGHSR